MPRVTEEGDAAAPQPRADPIARLVALLARLPGIGEKTATRLTYHLLTGSPELGLALRDAIGAVVERIRSCSVCCNLSEHDPCSICADPGRDRGLVCVVESVPDLNAIERTGAWRGLYHVLHGRLSPLEGVGPRDIRLAELDRRLAAGGVRELLVATNPTAEGDATAQLVARLPSARNLRVSRIATGIPVGGDLEYSDRLTLARALDGRRAVDDREGA
jgi:recombination protein RecR